MMRLLLIAFRNFIRNLKRYRVLLVAFVLVVAALTVVLGVASGMSETLRSKASRFFAGDIVVVSYDRGDSLVEDPELVERIVRSIDAPIRTVSRRSTFYNAADANLFHAGFYTRQRRFLGVEWDREADVLDGFDFVAGGVPDQGDQEGVLISSAAAATLQATVGDRIVASSATDRGRENTVELIVRGVFRETSFFGFATYMERRTLNRLLERPENRVNEIGVYLADPTSGEQKAAEQVTRLLSEHYPTFPVITDRETLSAESSLRRSERHYGVVTLAAQLAEINDLLFAMTAIAGVIIIMFLAITMIGVANTYTMITFERTREIGTLRALGMQARDAVFVFVAEAVTLSLAGLALGMVVGVGILAIVSSQLSYAPGGVTDLFLRGGRLIWQLPAGGLGAIAVLTVSAGTLGAMRASVRAGRTSPVDALRAS